MKMKTLFAVGAATFLAACMAFSAQEVKTLKLAAEGLTKLEIDCGAGFLVVKGAGGLGEIEVKAEISARGIDKDEMKKFIEDHVKLSLEKRGGQAVLTSEIREQLLFFPRDAVIDLTVSLPAGVALAVDDGSGSIDIRDIEGSVVIEDGSGELHVENVRGDLEVDDGSGEIEIRGVTGDVRIDDGSGTLRVVEVGGSLTIDDGSGSIDIDGVGKDLALKETGSGSLHFRNVKGRVIK